MHAGGGVNRVGADGGLEQPGIGEGAVVDGDGLQVERGTGVYLDGAAGIALDQSSPTEINAVLVILRVETEFE